MDRLSRPVGDLLALASGLALPLGFAPYGWYPVPVLALAVALATWLDGGPERGFWRGWLFGLGAYGHGVGWVHISIHQFTASGLPIALLVALLLAAYLALFPGLLAALLARSWARQRSIWRIAVALPCGWTLLEWLRGWLLTGFPWLDLGSSQVDAPLANLAPLAGHLGVGCAVAASAAALWLLAAGHAAARAVAVGALLLLWAAVPFVADRDWTEPSGTPFTAALVQGNVTQDQKWLPEARDVTLALYEDLTAPHWDKRLIVWPETAVPVFHDQVAEGYLSALHAKANAAGAGLLLGIPYRDLETNSYFNAMLALGGRPGLYLKRHLVPFGEYLPLRPVLGWVLDLISFPMSDFSRGAADQPPLLVGGHRVGISICFEDIFARDVRRSLPAAELLVNASNDAWFGDSIAPHQHLEMARMRALESGRYLLRATNTGISAIIDARGRLVARAPQFASHVLVAEVEPRRGETPYVRFGDWPVLALALLGALIAAFAGRRREAW